MTKKMSTVAQNIRRYAKYLFAPRRSNRAGTKTYINSIAHNFHRSQTFDLIEAFTQGQGYGEKVIDEDWHPSYITGGWWGDQFFRIPQVEIRQFQETYDTDSSMKRDWINFVKERLKVWKNQNKELLDADKFYEEYNKNSDTGLFKKSHALYDFDKYASLTAFESDHKELMKAAVAKPVVKSVSKPVAKSVSKPVAKSLSNLAGVSSLLHAPFLEGTATIEEYRRYFKRADANIKALEKYHKVLITNPKKITKSILEEFTKLNISYCKLFKNSKLC